MNHKLIDTPLEKIKTDCLVLGMFEDSKEPSFMDAMTDITKDWLTKKLHYKDLEGKQGQSLIFYDPPGLLAKRLMILGLGSSGNFHEKEYLKTCSHTLSLLKTYGIKNATLSFSAFTDGPNDADWRIYYGILAAEQEVYSFDLLKADSSKKTQLTKSIQWWISNPSSQQSKLVKKALATAHGIAYTKNLANLPGNKCTPSFLASEAKKLAKKYNNVTCSTIDSSQMQKLGMGAFLAVSKGSEEPPYLIILEYKAAPKKEKPIVLVGKGITFDSGGISLKPGQKMDEMKYDMSGAAAALGTISACAEQNLPINLVIAIAAAENMPDGKATRPGDVVTTLSGQTVEILNTDAEGRLVLCDTLTYIERFKPKYVVDLATLTGAAIIALGHEITALMGNNNQLVAQIKKAGETSYDRVWELPMPLEYYDLLKSNFADFANIGGRAAGTITAACFLSKFTTKYAWAHLDIAGTAWKSDAQKGATGRPVSLLMEFLYSQIQ